MRTLSLELLQLDQVDTAADGRIGSIAAVVCTYDEARWRQLWAAVRSLQRQRLRPTAIVIVVDHNARLLERVRAEVTRLSDDATPRPIVAANRHRRGLSGSRNSALDLTDCDLVAFLDDDAEAVADWLSQLAAGFSDPRVIAVGSRVIASWAGGSRPRWMPPELDWTVGCSHVGMPQRTSEVRNPFGGAMMLRRRAVIAAGGYHTSLGRVGNDLAGCEETELCIRLRRRQPDSVVLYQPAAAIHHHVPAVRARGRYVLRRCYAEGRSKALVSLLAGHQHGLASERRYLLRTLPRGIARELASLARGDLWAIARATMLVGGSVVAAVGLADGRRRASAR